jgi:hypothetical protein
MFEVINRRTANWEYLGSNHFTTFEYYLLCTISFSTVMPAVFETAELAASFKWVERFTFGPRVRDTAVLELAFFLAGTGMLLLTVAWPKYCYPSVWTSLVLILEPLNRWLEREHFMEYLERGGLAADRVAICWGVDLRIFLGDVELLFAAEVDLSHAGSPVFACIRDAATCLWRVRAVCAGVVCIEKSFVARGA